MNWKHRIRFALVLSCALFAAAPGASRAQESSAPIAGIPVTGAPGVPESISDIMQRMTEAQAAGRIRTELEDVEKELEQPDRSGLPRNPKSPDVTYLPELPEGFQPGVGSEEGPFTPQVIGTTFTGATLAGVNPTLAFPPDCMGAVGPSQYVVFVNGRLVTFNKTTGLADGVLNVDPDVFFGSVMTGGSYTSDPRIRYDRLTGRWFLVIIDVATPNRILFAVSDAASANALTGGTVFTFFFIPIASTPPAISNTCLADYPTLGLDANALYIGTNNFCGSPSQTFNSSDGYVVRKSSIMGAGPLVVTVFRGIVATSASAGPYTPQGVDNFDPSAGEGFFIGVDNATFGTLMMRRVSSPGGTPSISGNISITVPSTSFPIRVEHLGNTGGANGRLSALDDRLFAAHIRNGKLWTAHNIGVTNTGATSGATLTRNASRWYELNVPPVSGTPTIVQSGTVFTPTGTNVTTARSYWIPSILVSGQGHAAMGFSVAGTNERANAATVGRLVGDTGGTMQTPELFSNSTTAYNPPSDPGGSNGRRWGDYSYTSLDPQDDMTMWTVQEFCDATNSYGVRVAKLIAPPPATPSSIPDVAAGANPVNVTLTGVSVSGSGFYDPGPNLGGNAVNFNHIQVNILNGAATGTPPTVVSATYVNPTTIDLVLDASAATASIGAERYSVQVKNPDNQMISAAILRVTGGAPPNVTINPAGPSLAEGNAGTKAFQFAVLLSAASGSPITVGYTTADSTATAADGDYQAVTSSIVIPAGATSDTITVNVNGDVKYENDEYFKVTLTSATGGTLTDPKTAVGTILNDDLPPNMFIDNVTQVEGNAGTTQFAFTVTLTEASGLPVSASAITVDGTATVANNDYQPDSLFVSFAPGETSKPVDINVNGDLTLEADEVFSVLLINRVGAGVGDTLGTGMILNDDAVPTLDIAGYSQSEGNVGTQAYAFVVTISNPTDQAVTVQYQTSDSTATSGSDYAATSGMLTFPAKSADPDTIIVFVNGDTCAEGDEVFQVRLFNPTGGAVLGTDTGIGTIVNDDAPTINAAVVAPNGGETYYIGAIAILDWNVTGAATVDLRLSRDNGLTWANLATGIPNSGSYNWTVTGPASVDALIEVRATDACGVVSDRSDATFIIASPTSGVHPLGPISEFRLGLIHPNPSSGATTVDFELPRESRIRLTVVDLQGREVARLADGTFGAGRYQASWNGRTEQGPAAMGVYFVHYEGGGKSFTQRLVLAR